MRVLAANLRLYYQRRGLWITYAWLFLIFFLSLFTWPSWYNVIIIMILGVVAADSQRELFSKPFAFLLPHQRVKAKRLVFGIGLISSFLWALWAKFLYYPDFPSGLSAFVSAFVLAFILYLGSALTILLLKAAATSSFVVFWFLSMGFALFSVVRIVVSCPLWTITGGVIFIWLTWKWLDPQELARRFSGKMLLGFLDEWNVPKSRTYYKKKRLEKLSRKDAAFFNRLQSIFVDRMKVQPVHEEKRFVLGNLFVNLSKMQNQPGWSWLLFLISPAIFLGYLGELPASLILFLFPFFISIQMDLIPHRSLLTPGGRTEKFHAALVLALLMTALMTALVAFVGWITVPNRIMPDIPQLETSFSSINLRLIYLTIAGVPTGLVLGTVYGKKPLNLLCIPAALGAMFLIIYFNESLAQLVPATAQGKAAFIAIAWLGSVVFLNYYCRRKDLIGQGG